MLFSQTFPVNSRLNIRPNRPLKTLISILFLFFVTQSFANATNSGVSSGEKCKPGQDQANQPDKKDISPSVSTYYEEGAIKAESMEFESPAESPQTIPMTGKIDTVNSSISKYNYLFYFIYKYKFEQKFGLDQIERMITD